MKTDTVQQNWEKRIAKSLNTMCTELNVPLAKKRSDKDSQELSSHWTEVGTMEIGMTLDMVTSVDRIQKYDYLFIYAFDSICQTLVPVRFYVAGILAM